MNRPMPRNSRHGAKRGRRDRHLKMALTGLGMARMAAMFFAFIHYIQSGWGKGRSARVV